MSGGVKCAQDGYQFTYFEKPGADKALLIIGQDRRILVKACAKYFNSLGASLVAIGSNPTGRAQPGVHSFPLECIESAIEYLRARGIRKVGTMGASTTGMLALAAAAYVPDISIAIACTPCDYTMQGFIKGKPGGKIPEWPAVGESALTRGGKALPYAPYGVSAQEYYDLSYGKATKDAGELNAIQLFSRMEKNGIPDEALIPIERINGPVYVFGAQDDTLWPTAIYIRRMTERMKAHGRDNLHAHIYPYGTHLMFPQGLVDNILPFGLKFALGRVFKSAKAHPDECAQTRRDMDKAVRTAIAKW